MWREAPPPARHSSGAIVPGTVWFLLAMLGGVPAPAGAGDRGGGAEFPRDFAPSEGLVQPQEQPFRAEICLNGSWQFQAVDLPPGYQPGRDPAPTLPPPDPARWERTPIKIPS